jgi:succinate dehydrogenase / fumarate reductase membrane anchor subunit
MLLLILALFHGLNGLRILVDDYIHSKGWRIVSLSTLYTIAFVFFALGALVILTFQVPPGVR